MQFCSGLHPCRRRLGGPAPSSFGSAFESSLGTCADQVDHAAAAVDSGSGSTQYFAFERSADRTVEWTYSAHGSGIGHIATVGLQHRSEYGFLVIFAFRLGWRRVDSFRNSAQDFEVRVHSISFDSFTRGRSGSLGGQPCQRRDANGSLENASVDSGQLMPDFGCWS